MVVLLLKTKSVIRDICSTTYPYALSLIACLLLLENLQMRLFLFDSGFPTELLLLVILNRVVVLVHGFGVVLGTPQWLASTRLDHISSVNTPTVLSHSSSIIGSILSSRHLSLPLWRGLTHHDRHGSSTTRTRWHSALSMSSSSSSMNYDEQCDVLILGSGPAARSLAALLAATKNRASSTATAIDVLLCDQQLDREWVPNYGVWQDEWMAIVNRYRNLGVVLDGGNVGMAIDRAWNVTDCYFGGSYDIPPTNRMRLDRPYYRIDRKALRQTLTTRNEQYRTLRANHFSEAMNVNIYQPAGSILHDEHGTTIELALLDDKSKTSQQQGGRRIIKVRAKLVVDCTGHESKLILRETRGPPFRPPGFQIAYGALVDVEKSNPDPIQTATSVTTTTTSNDLISHIGPYDKEAMTLFDYRTDHFEDNQDDNEKGIQDPTFMYVMPIRDNTVFFEETSLVARPGLSFQECKDRCIRRLSFHGIQITKIYEEEYCYIPMGGALPMKDQRIIALGGSAGMVHPSTGFHLCRCLMGSADVAETIIQQLNVDSNNNNNGSSNNPNLDQIAALAYHALWTPDNIRQRNFAVYGGEFLMKQNVIGLRGFFDGFFRLSTPLWGGFLAGWPGLPYNENHENWFARLWFGISFVIRLPPSVALAMFTSIITYSIAMGPFTLIQSVTPFFGEPDSYEYQRNMDRIGDIAAKSEARQMILESKVDNEIPVAFNDEDYDSNTNNNDNMDLKESTVSINAIDNNNNIDTKMLVENQVVS